MRTLHLSAAVLGAAALAPTDSVDQLVTYDMEMTYGSPSGQMAFLDVVEKAILG